MATSQEVAQVKQMVKESIIEEGLDPNIFVRLGEMAQAVLKDKSMYPQFLQAVVDSGLAEEADFSGDVDYQIIGVFVAAGEMVKEMLASGELGA
jgi:hypothetical protein